MRLKKLAAVMLTAAVFSSFSAGCGNAVNIDAAAATLDGKDISMGVANFIAQCQAVQMDSYLLAYYGEDMWDSDSGDGTTMTESVKKTVMDNLWEYYLMDAHAADYGVEITEEEKAAITAAATQFMADNSTEAVSKMNATQENVEEMLRLYKVQSKMRAKIEEEIDTNVSDEECAQKTFSYVRFSKSDASSESDTSADDTEKKDPKAEAEEFLKNAAENMESAAETGGYSVLKCSYGAGDLKEDDNTTSMDTKVLKAADKLKDGQAADAVIETDSDYYVIRMDSTDDKEAAENKKSSILSQRRNDKYDEVLQEFKDASKWTVNEKEWKKVNFDELYTIKAPEENTTADDGAEAPAEDTAADSGAETPAEDTAADSGAENTAPDSGAETPADGGAETPAEDTAADGGTETPAEG